jgi:hypothetical protein
MRRWVASSAVGFLVALLPTAEVATQIGNFDTVATPSEMADTVWDIEIEPLPVSLGGPVLRGRLHIGRLEASTPPSLTRDPISTVFPAFITLDSDPALEWAIARTRSIHEEERRLANPAWVSDVESEPVGPRPPFPTGRQMIEIAAVKTWLPPHPDAHPPTWSLGVPPGEVGSSWCSVWFSGQMHPGLFEGTMYGSWGICAAPPFAGPRRGRPFRMRRIA